MTGVIYSFYVYELLIVLFEQGLSVYTTFFIFLTNEYIKDHRSYRKRDFLTGIFYNSSVKFKARRLIKIPSSQHTLQLCLTLIIELMSIYFIYNREIKDMKYNSFHDFFTIINVVKMTVQTLPLVCSGPRYGWFYFIYL